MALVSLLTMPSDPRARRAWMFEHAMAHRNFFGVMTPLNRFSGLPYFINPMLRVNQPAGTWLFDHQQAHNDALQNLPTQWAWQFISTTTPNPTPPPPTITTITSPAITRGLRIGGNLIDFNLSVKRQLTWWTFQNHSEHFVAAQTVLPAPSPPPAPQWTFPFW